jgi:hypothetical protein
MTKFEIVRKFIETHDTKRPPNLYERFIAFAQTLGPEERAKAMDTNMTTFLQTLYKAKKALDATAEKEARS